MPQLLPQLLAAAGAVALLVGSIKACTTRLDCSSHGDCVIHVGDSGAAGTCVCDPLFHGPRCDVWRTPVDSAARAELMGVKWENCTHGIPPGHGSRVVALCNMENKLECEAVGGATVADVDNIPEHAAAG